MNTRVPLAITFITAALTSAAAYDYGVRCERDRSAASVAAISAAHAVAVANAERASRAYVQAATERANAAEAELLGSDHRIAATRAAVLRSLPRVDPDHPPAGGPPRCALDAGWLRLYNASLGLGDLPASAGGDAAAPADDPDTAAPATTAGLLAGADRADAGAGSAAAVDAASLNDLLAHVADVGVWCQSAAAERDALIAAQPAN